MRALALSVAMLFLLVLAPVGFAKEGVMAQLGTPVPTHVAAGRTVQFAWTLGFVEEGAWVPFDAEGVFLRIVPSGGGVPIEAAEYAVQARLGQYSALVAVPPGGIEGVEIGVRGEPSDFLFPVVEKASGLQRASKLTAAGSGGFPAWAAGLVALLLAGLAGAAVVLRRRLRPSRRARALVRGWTPPPASAGRACRGWNGAGREPFARWRRAPRRSGAFRVSTSHHQPGHVTFASGAEQFSKR